MHAGQPGGQFPREFRREGDELRTLLDLLQTETNSSDGLGLCLQVGYDLKEEIERKFDKWQEPPPVKQVKPLPAPLDGQRKKRGGRRCRHW